MRITYTEEFVAQKEKTLQKVTELTDEENIYKIVRNI